MCAPTWKLEAPADAIFDTLAEIDDNVLASLWKPLEPVSLRHSGQRSAEPIHTPNGSATCIADQKKRERAGTHDK